MEKLVSRVESKYFFSVSVSVSFCMLPYLLALFPPYSFICKDLSYLVYLAPKSKYIWNYFQFYWGAQSFCLNSIFFQDFVKNCCVFDNLSPQTFRCLSFFRSEIEVFFSLFFKICVWRLFTFWRALLEKRLSKVLAVKQGSQFLRPPTNSWFLKLKIWFARSLRFEFWRERWNLGIWFICLQHRRESITSAVQCVVNHWICSLSWTSNK